MTAKDTKGKPKLSYIPYEAMVRIAEVRQFGVDKYGDDTCWRQVDQRDFLDAALRHIYKHLDGVDVDPESGLTHVAHAATSLILALGLKAPRRQYTSDEIVAMLDQIDYEEAEPFSHEQAWDSMDFPSEKEASDYMNLEYDDSVYHPTHLPRR